MKHQDPIRFAREKQACLQQKKTCILGCATLREVWSDMEKTILPTWCTASPTRIGDGNHGKISADGWRTFGSVHLIVTLGRLWGILLFEDRKYKLFTNFCALVHATKIATMRSVTTASAQEFEDTMFAYLRGICELFPSYEFVPSYHVTLHMKELLCRFGPTHAWRCWVFERCHGLPPSYLISPFLFRTVFQAAFPIDYITYLWNILAFSRDFHKVP